MGKIIPITTRGADGANVTRHINTRYIVSVSNPFQGKHFDNKYVVCMELATQDQTQCYSYHETEKEARELIDYIVNECNRTEH